ncbi:3',5'-cyclic adenosine monophosphate phosphodiesterase CpdA [mine drainage metagenome]|uniref:3',5'-cyclic adenosine monophosphate phosphodiesterase CpdA n=1 Tax=mine drainage metagenome TaxID=410659 RepID=A0A1J5RBQ9_9ZZZZ
MAIVVHLLSDLHLEFSQYQPHSSSDRADIVLAAGDVWHKDRGIRMLRAMWPDKEIVTVSGNQEHYKATICPNMELMRAAADEVGIHFLENNEKILTIRGEKIRILGCTLWTNFLLYGLEKRADCMVDAGQYLNDFRLIRNGSWNFSPKDSINLHNASVKWLESKLDEPFDGPTIVMTHHAPSYKSVVKRFQGDLLSACFASNLDHLMDGSKVDLWCHGHMHDDLDYYINGTRVMCNPRGYCRFEGGEENHSFNPALLISVEKGKVELVESAEDKAAERLVPMLSGRKRNELIWAIDHLQSALYWYPDGVVEYIDLRLITSDVRWFAEAIVQEKSWYLKTIPERIAVWALAVEDIDRLVNVIVKRSRVTKRAAKRSPRVSAKEEAIAALNRLQIRTDINDKFKYYELAELPNYLRTEYWRTRFGSTQPVVPGAVEPVYLWDYETWRERQLRKLKS